MTTTDVIAWIGCVTGSLSLAWEIYTWFHTGARIRVKVSTDMRVQGNPPTNGKDLTIVDATNVGDRPATLEKMGLAHYPNFMSYITRKPAYFYVKNPGFQHSFPHVLDVGCQWSGYTIQGADFDRMTSTGRLYVRLYVAGFRRPVSVRVIRHHTGKKKTTATPCV